MNSSSIIFNFFFMKEPMKAKVPRVHKNSNAVALPQFKKNKNQKTFYLLNIMS